MILEGLYKSKLQGSVQLQIVLALYDRETAQLNIQTIYLRLKTAVKLCIDQVMRTRNFTVRNEVVERGSVTESQKRENACGERKVGKCCHWRAHGKCSKGDSCSFSHDTVASGKCKQVKDQKDDRCLPHQIRRQRLTKGEEEVWQQRGKHFRQ